MVKQSQAAAGMTGRSLSFFRAAPLSHRQDRVDMVTRQFKITFNREQLNPSDFIGPWIGYCENVQKFSQRQVAKLF